MKTIQRSSMSHRAFWTVSGYRKTSFQSQRPTTSAPPPLISFEFPGITGTLQSQSGLEGLEQGDNREPSRAAYIWIPWFCAAGPIHQTSFDRLKEIKWASGHLRSERAECPPPHPPLLLGPKSPLHEVNNPLASINLPLSRLHSKSPSVSAELSITRSKGCVYKGLAEFAMWRESKKEEKKRHAHTNTHRPWITMNV